jgi:ABC-type lipoprotein export system ATPase subunit
LLEDAALVVAAKAGKNPHLAVALRNKTQDVLADYQSKPEFVAVVGKIGQGKSRLIDTLLGIDQIAKSVSTTS